MSEQLDRSAMIDTLMRDYKEKFRWNYKSDDDDMSLDDLFSDMDSDEYFDADSDADFMEGLNIPEAFATTDNPSRSSIKDIPRFDDLIGSIEPVDSPSRKSGNEPQEQRNYRNKLEAMDLSELSKVYESSKQERLESFEKYLISRQDKREETYGAITGNIASCRMSADKNGENILADIMRKNEEEGMGNYKVPGTHITLINYSICPSCKTIFSFKDLRLYYNKPNPDPAFETRNEQYRQDTRMCCNDCGTYFLPSLVISDGIPRNEMQFLCRMQTVSAIENYFAQKGKKVLTTNPQNRIRRGKSYAILNDVLLQDLSEKPTLVTNLLQYTPDTLAFNLILGSNVKKGDLLFGSCNWR
jgi:hypothetical protein